MSMPADDGLFVYDAPPPVSLADRFGVPPFTILDRRGGPWLDRKRKWLSMGIRSELGRDSGLVSGGEDSGFFQHGLPLEKRSDRTLQGMLDSQVGTHARDAQAELDRRVASGRRVLDGAPPPGGGGTGAWKGRTAGGDMRAIDPKWDAPQGTPGRLIPGGNEGGAYDRSRGGTLAGGYRANKANPDDRTTDKTMTARPLSSGGAFMTAEERMRRQLNAAGAHKDQDKLNALTGQDTLTGTSIFDPVLCELAYRWFTAPDMRVLDPFAGGSVRGLVASVLQRQYLGIDLRAAQVEANREQVALLHEPRHVPRWVAGDSAKVLETAPREAFDLVFSCPPYADLEVYSDDPADISNMPYERFLEVHADIVGKACAALKPDRFAVWVISDVRDKRGGYRCLPDAVRQHFRDAGLSFYNEGVILDPVGSAAVRAGRIFLGGRKLIRMHQLMLVFVKGDWKRATEAISAQEQVLEVPVRAEESGT